MRMAARKGSVAAVRSHDDDLAMINPCYHRGHTMVTSFMRGRRGAVNMARRASARKFFPDRQTNQRASGLQPRRRRRGKPDRGLLPCALCRGFGT